MKSEAEWQAQVKGLLKAEMKRRNLTYEQLAERLAAVGVQTSAPVLRVKVSRGGFSAVFLMQCLEAIGCKSVVIDDS